MEKQRDQFNHPLSKRLLSLIAIILAFIALLVVIWLWYNIRLKELDHKLQQPADKDIPAKTSTKL